MNAPTPTAVIIKQEFDSIVEPYYNEFLRVPKHLIYNKIYNRIVTIVELNLMHHTIRRQKRKSNQLFDTETQDLNEEFIATLPKRVKIDYAILYYDYTGIFHTYLTKDDLNRIITKEDYNAYKSNFKHTMITQAKTEAFLDTNVSTYLNLDVITHVLRFLL